MAAHENIVIDFKDEAREKRESAKERERVQQVIVNIITIFNQ